MKAIIIVTAAIIANAAVVAGICAIFSASVEADIKNPPTTTEETSYVKDFQ